ncbi:hypothetical protein DIPPA_07473 [Diplonema papillatum]|nr:hypothetical protein DIPPA_07473 [Diplonema papillatum]
MWTALCSLPLLALASIDYTQEQSHSDSNWMNTSAWRCGNALNSNAFNPLAGVVELKASSLDHVRTDPAELAGLSAEDLAKVQQKSFSDLFCYEYLARYQNDIEENGTPGVCIRDATVGQKWLSILATDDETKMVWEMFGTSYGYQKAAPKFKEQEDDGNLRWGSGRTGSVPANWCANFMKDMLCHVAFPQFADTRASIATGTGVGTLVRPVCSDDCENLMDNCNRHQPDPYENVEVPWLQGFESDTEESLDNVLYCKAWNKGYHLARAGTGVAEGDDNNDVDFCATFESSSALYPMVAVTIIASLFALLF